MPINSQTPTCPCWQDEEKRRTHDTFVHALGINAGISLIEAAEKEGLCYEALPYYIGSILAGLIISTIPDKELKNVEFPLMRSELLLNRIVLAAQERLRYIALGAANQDKMQ